MKKKAVFLDRDGTINEDSGYIGNPNLIKLLPGVAEGIKILKDELNFLIVVISNQSGVARGYFTVKDVLEVNKRLNEILISEDTKIDHFYFCPHHPDFNSEEECNCRKPSPKMVLDAAKKLNINLDNSYFVGDKFSDILCGKNAGVKTILLKNSINEKKINQLKNSQNSPNFISSNFLDAVIFIKKNSGGDNFEI
ncbi:MAG: hypothetical protein CR986_07215 [Ignavibacteriae bacterium]|nr:MAG: hypothetical protein CR986_07215 [Ignavibacteriota bacterium]